jgi:stringent starvation protein B
MTTSKRPYLLRAINEWLLDNGMTPHILVDARDGNVEVPRQFVEDGRIVLNISPSAVRELSLDNELLTCSARFNRKSFNIRVPVRYVLAIYGKESGMGMVFPEDEPVTGPGPGAGRLEKAPHLKLVK